MHDASLKSRLTRPQVISLAGELLSLAEELIRDGLHPSEILEGYKKASVMARLGFMYTVGVLTSALQALDVLQEIVLPGTEVLDMRDEKEVAKRLRARKITAFLPRPRSCHVAGNNLEQAVRTRGARDALGSKGAGFLQILSFALNVLRFAGVHRRVSKQRAKF